MEPGLGADVIVVGAGFAGLTAARVPGEHGARVLPAIDHNGADGPWSRGAWISEPPLWVVDGILDLVATPHGRIIMAGADIATVYPGWIAGAINSGHVAAQEAVQLLGVLVGKGTRQLEAASFPRCRPERSRRSSYADRRNPETHLLSGVVSSSFEGCYPRMSAISERS